MATYNTMFMMMYVIIFMLKNKIMNTVLYIILFAWSLVSLTFYHVMRVYQYGGVLFPADEGHTQALGSGGGRCAGGCHVADCPRTSLRGRVRARDKTYRAQNRHGRFPSNCNLRTIGDGSEEGLRVLI